MIRTLKQYYFLLPILFSSCVSPEKKIEKVTILKADREAPLGWVYLNIFEDSSFDFTLTGIRGDKDIFIGKVDIRNDSLFFHYSNKIPKAGKTALYNSKAVAYIDGQYPERLNISSATLSK